MSVRKWLTLLIFSLLMAALGAQSASAQQPSLYAAITVTGVTSGTPAVGSEFTTDVQVSINTQGPGLVGIEIYLGYDPAIVTPVDTDSSTPGVQPAELRSDFFGTNPTPAANEVITAAGIVAPGLAVPGRTCPGAAYPCVHLSLVGTPPQTNKTAVIARLHWMGSALGLPGFGILVPVVAPPPYPAPPRTALSDADGYLIPINSATASTFSILTPGQIGGIVLRQGVPPSVPATGTLGCTQVDALNGSVVSGPAFTLITPPPTSPLPFPPVPAPVFAPQVLTQGGFMLVVRSGAGTYTVRASYPGYLQAEKSGVYVSGSDVLIGTTKLYGGDVNGDGAINILDIVAVIGNLGATVPIRSTVAACTPFSGGQGDATTVPPTDSAFDINDDGIVDISDLSIAAGNFSRTGPTAWGP